MLEKSSGQAQGALDAILASLPGEEVRLSNSLGTVTENWVIVRPANGESRALLSIDSLQDVRRIKTTYPGLLVIAAGLALIAAAAYFSKQGNGAGPPLALISVFFVAAYFGTRRASLIFSTATESIETVLGSLREAAEMQAEIQQLSGLQP